ncbi:hypothetical protein HS1genome_1613 [Sulfodiicoccus acidiphilus]|uniref:Uncharacterized protein n=1 Tax=Sulfodiicoccus acidiphilus TaxID=1670455 RepID=A0A348B4X2_9CREN|nr:hypothetical protein [Sulfodiicoccus acidiphilus]BBD73224.1 hypothetical protein HS1genome_1613 [Sulfodiicoccus acidiphilus]GGT89803.1 hypothetical protein GCM10007116_04560 [Sulfodiicoccus acidiphilus]
MAVSASELLARVRSPMLFGRRPLPPLKVDTRDVRALFAILHKQDSVELHLHEDYLLELLELAGALRESKKSVRIEGIETGPEGPPGRPIVLNMIYGTPRDPRFLTWFVHPDLGVSYDRSKTVEMDVRALVVSSVTGRSTYVVFERAEGEFAVGRVVGKEGGEVAVRPNMWLTGASIVSLRWDGREALAPLRELLRRPLGATYVPVNGTELSVLFKAMGWRSRGLG